MTPGGVLLPDMAKEKPRRGVVLAYESGRLLNDGSYAKQLCRTGHTVIFTAYAGTEIEDRGHKLLIMDDSDILAVTD